MRLYKTAEGIRWRPKLPDLCMSQVRADQSLGPQVIVQFCSHSQEGAVRMTVGLQGNESALQLICDKYDLWHYMSLSSVYLLPGFSVQWCGGTVSCAIRTVKPSLLFQFLPMSSVSCNRSCNVQHWGRRGSSGSSPGEQKSPHTILHFLLTSLKLIDVRCFKMLVLRIFRHSHWSL